MSIESGSGGFVSGPWGLSVDEVCSKCGVEREQGLDKKQVKGLIGKFGPNKLREAEKVSLWLLLFNQVKSLIVILLAVTAVLSFAFQEWMDGFAITGVIVINTAIGFFIELKAVRSMEALHQMEKVTARVRRGGKVIEVSAKQLVPGDVVILEGGDLVSADMRLVVSGKLQADESVLTGESLPVSKRIDAIDAEAGLADRVNMLYKGTAVTRGSGEAIVTATGMGTELGKITDLVQKADDEVTPLEKRLDSLGKNLLWVTLVLIVIIAVTGILRGKDVVAMIETAIALAVAAIPEGLPIVATLALARGMLRMAKRNALVNELAAVETLGGVSVICTDKTGTLTENKMTVVELIFSDERVGVGRIDEKGHGEFSIAGAKIDPIKDGRVKRLLEIGVLCNNASLKDGPKGAPVGIGDPLEVAFLVAAGKAEIDYEKVNKEYPEVREDAFDSDSKKMATFNGADGEYYVAVKGALEAILDDSGYVATANGKEEMTEQWKGYWDDQNASLAEQGYRVLALAMKHVGSVEAEPYSELVFVGLACMEDPAREDVKQSIEECRQAGIRTVMITGDHPKTAASIAESVSLRAGSLGAVIVGKDIKPYASMTDEDKKMYAEASVFARVSPEQKLDLIAVHQNAGSVVAMTGDGVNDAPALKKADIGIAMGLRGTQVAQEAADMVLKDDSFSTIVVAVEQGRIIFENIRKFVIYLLSCNISEVMVVFAASLVGAPMPLLPLQILFLNLVTDVFPALALGAGKGSPGIMEDPPKASDEPILPKSGWSAIFGYGGLITVSVLVAFAIAFKMFYEEGKESDLITREAVTVSFLTLAMAQLWNIFNMRGNHTTMTKNDIVSNSYVWAALGLSVALLLVAVYLPPLAELMELSNPGLKGWVLVMVASSMTCVVGQVVKIFKK